MERFETDHSACAIAVSGLGASRRLYLPAKIGQEMCFCGGGGEGPARTTNQMSGETNTSFTHLFTRSRQGLRSKTGRGFYDVSQMIYLPSLHRGFLMEVAGMDLIWKAG